MTAPLNMPAGAKQQDPAQDGYFCALEAPFGSFRRFASESLSYRERGICEPRSFSSFSMAIRGIPAEDGARFAHAMRWECCL